MSSSVGAVCCCEVDAPTLPLPQDIRGDAWGHVGDRYDVASARG